ncbi:MAG: S1 RNA-binding domain-containing protein [Candidatus Omnitrophota bacterium]
MEDSAVKTDAVKIDDVVEAEVIKITDFGAFVKFGSGKKGLIHISQVSDSYVKKVDDHLKIGDKVKAKIMKVSPDGKIDLTLKSGAPRKDDQNGRQQGGPRPYRGDQGGSRRPGNRDNSFRENMSSSPDGKSFRTSSFEDKLKGFLKESGERQSDLKKHIEEKQPK